MQQPDILKATTDILNKLSLIKDDNGQVVFKTVAVFNDHYQRLVNGKGFSYLTPAVFLEFKWTKTTVLNLGLAASDLDVIFHIVDNQLDAMDGTLDQNLTQLNLRRYIIRDMTEFYPTGMSGFMYQRGQADYNHTDTYHRIVTFKTIYLDQDALYTNTGQYYKNPPVTLVINGIISAGIPKAHGISYDQLGYDNVI